MQFGTVGPDTGEGSIISPSLTATWQRYTVTGEIDADDTAEFYLAVPDGCTVSLWGAQMENSSTAGPYDFQSDGLEPTTVAHAEYTTSSFSAGVHHISAVYSGDSNNAGSTANFIQYVGVSGIADAGTVSLTVAGETATANYDINSTASSVAQTLAQGFAQLTDSPVTVTASGSQLTLAAKASGGSTDYSYSVNVTYDSQDFASASFSPSSYSGDLTGGSLGSLTTLYSYTVPAGGYDTNGNVLAFEDSVMGNWSFGYDQLNRLITAQAANSSSAWSPYFCWAYDSFGNRLAQSNATQAFTTTDGACTSAGTLTGNVLSSFNSQNQMTSTTAPGTPIPSLGYDNAGDVTTDNQNTYLYDADGRICAVNDGTRMVGYLYDASGHRTAKGTITSMSCDPNANGFQETSGYIVDGGGQQLTEVGESSQEWVHTNVWANGQLIGTYDGQGLHFHFEDPLGTRRLQASSSGTVEATYLSLPYGDGFSSTGTDDPTENHFTGKERDAESGNDYMFARYYNSATGRFLSPDWDAKSSDPVPYAKLGDPQSLNLYQYVGNNPILSVDATGHKGCKMNGAPQEGGCSDLDSENARKCEDLTCDDTKRDKKSPAHQQEAAVAYAANTHGTVPEGEAVVSVIVNRVASKQSQYGCKKGSCTVNDVLSHKPGFAEVGSHNYTQYLKGQGANPGAQNAAQAAQDVALHGPTTKATFYITNPGGAAPSSGQVHGLGHVVPANPGQVGGVYLYVPAPRPPRPRNP